MASLPRFVYILKSRKPATGEPLGYVAGEDAWYGHASGPNKIRHRVRICLKTGNLTICPTELSKSLSARDWGFQPRFILISKRLEGKTISAGSKEPAYGAVSASGDRWITVHPHGDSEDGYPVKIQQNHDGSWRITGGAGGALNGLKLHHVKTPHEYKQAAKEKQERAKLERGQKRDAEYDKVAARHRDELSKEALDSGKTYSPHEFETEALRRADAEMADRKRQRDAQSKDYAAEAHEREKELISQVAKSQGWDEGALALNDEQKAAARKAAEAEIREKSPDISQEAVNRKAEAAVQQLERMHHERLLSRAREVLDNHRTMILATHQELAERGLGDLQVGDLVKDVIGNRGKGYAANLAQEALDRGIDEGHIRDLAAANAYQNLLERKEGDVEAVKTAQAAIERMQDGAARSRSAVKRAQESAGAVGAGLEHIANLNATPTGNAGSSADLLAAARKLEAGIAAAKQGAQAAKEPGVDLETLPAAAVVAGREISHEEAMRRVVQDLEERERQRAVGGLHQLYNVQEGAGSLRSHTLAGHNGFFGAVGQHLGLRAPDPLMADILGPSASAHVMRRAIERAGEGDDGQLKKAHFEATRKALREQHIDTQVANCDAATEAAGELFNAADAIGEGNLETVDGLLDGISRNQRRLKLVNQGREQVGVAMGKLEAAAALNEALMNDRIHGGDPGGREDVQVALGAMSLRDAHTRAAALGLTQPDAFDEKGNLTGGGEYHIAHDGKNAILQIHQSGLDTLADQLREDPAHLERAAKVAAIKAGEHDEKDWLPAGFSRRPAVDVSGADPLELPREPDFTLEGVRHAAGIEARLRDYIGRRVEMGSSPVDIASTLRSETFKNACAEGPLEEPYRAAVNTLLPAISATKSADEFKGQLERQAAAVAAIHDDWIKGEVAAGRMPSEQASVHRQVLPQDWKTRDLVYQAVLQDPRLQHAFADVGSLDRSGRRAVRDYAYEHVFKVNPKDREAPIEPLSGPERKAWDAWRKLTAENIDPYLAIQKHWREQDEREFDHRQASAAASGLLGGFFDDDEKFRPHGLSTVDLSSDEDVVKCARDNAGLLGYEPQRRITDIRAGQYEDVVPELEVDQDQPIEAIARGARQRIQGVLRRHAFDHILGAPDVSPGFNPETVHTAGDRWGDYVRDIGGETRAYRSIQETMRGDFAGRFAKGYRQLHGEEFKTVPVALTHGDAHYMASLSPERRRELAADKARQAAIIRKREGARFAAEGEGAVANKLEAKEAARQTSSAIADSLSSKTDAHRRASHRLSLGAAAEGMIAGMVPKINLKRGTAAAADIDMSGPEGVKRQRAVKQLVECRRLIGSLGVGTGKTSIALACHGELKARGETQRSLMAVPSVVQEQFGSEAARFFDPTSKHFPTWFADSSASAAERRRAYHQDSGHDIVVVTHQALRDDLVHALAQHRFGGDTDAAAEFLMTAPRHERATAMQKAVEDAGWDFGFTTTDESHVLLGRGNYEGSLMGRAINALTDGSKYALSTSADPVKNDACVHPDTLIEDAETGESMSIREWSEAGRAPAVWALGHDNQPQLAQASVPFAKHRAPMYRVTLESGEQIVVAGSHRFLTPEGWKPLTQMREGQALATGHVKRQSNGIGGVSTSLTLTP